MPLSKNLTTYLDVKAVLTRALTHSEGIIYTPVNAKGNTTPGTAINFVQRANYYRVLRSRADPNGTTAFDNLRFVAEGETVRIEPNTPRGSFTDLAGNPLREGSKADTLRPNDDDPSDLLANARALRAEMFRDED